MYVPTTTINWTYYMIWEVNGNEGGGEGGGVDLDMRKDTETISRRPWMKWDITRHASHELNVWICEHMTYRIYPSARNILQY